ncbi:MAG: response regulator [Deltaproteobacteria bacterium]|nr:response regulator [Deltaproteobacteria bacterium]
MGDGRPSGHEKRRGEATKKNVRLPILFLEDQEKIWRELQAALRGIWPVRCVSTVREARELIASGQVFAGAMLDVVLPDGRGTEILTMLRRSQPSVRIVMVTGYHDRDVIEASYRAGAEYMQKPFKWEHYTAFARRIALSELIPDDDVSCRHLGFFAAERELSIRETEVLALAAQHLDRCETARRLGLSPRTVQQYAEALSKKCGGTELRQLAWNVCAALTNEEAARAEAREREAIWALTSRA